MKKTYLCGYYGMQNSGDDALLCATMSGARAHLQAESFVVNTPRKIMVPKHGPFQPMINVAQRYRGENRVKQCFNAFRSNQIIFGGGSVLHCKRDMDVKYLMMKLAGRGPHMALGVGIEGFANVAAEKSCRRFLNHCDYVGVRDSASYEVARAIAPDANVELTFDLAPSLLPIIDEMYPAHSNLRNDRIDINALRLEDGGIAMASRETARRGIGVLLCPRESIQNVTDDAALLIEKQRIRDIALALTELHDETGQPVYIFDMNGHQTLGDVDVHDELQSQLAAHVPVFRYGYQSNPLRLISQLRRLSFCVAMRLHGSIFSYLADTPVLSVNYHDKCLGWCEQIGLPEKYRFAAEQIDIVGMVDAAKRGFSEGFEKCRLSVDQAYQQSVKNFTSPPLLI